MHFYSSRRLRVRCTGGTLGLLFWLAATVLVATPSRGDDYVLLQNGNVIRGTASTVGPLVVIRRDQSNEVKLDARQVAHIAPTMRELYEFRVARRQVRDTASYHDDARWCFRNGLYAEMAEALDAAQQFNPSHPETIRLRRQLQQALDAAAKPSAVHSPASVDAEPVSVAVELPTARQQPRQTSDDDLMSLNLSSDALVYFTSRVQPILINRCGNNGCHRSPGDAPWQLTHMGIQVRPPARMTRLNLVATLKLINQAQPENSKLLQYAVQPHGGRREPPLRTPDDVALESLRQWAHTAFHSQSGETWAPLTPLGEMPTEATAIVPPAAQPFSPAATVSSVQQVGFVDDELGELPLPVVPPAPRQVQPVAPSGATRPTRLPPVENPFDPEIFNRLYRQ